MHQNVQLGEEHDGVQQAASEAMGTTTSLNSSGKGAGLQPETEEDGDGLGCH